MGSINFNPVPMNFELVSFRVELGFEGENEKRLAFGASHEKVDNLDCVRVDEYGFFIYWKSEGREGDVKELSQVNDIRGGELPKVKTTVITSGVATL